MTLLPINKNNSPEALIIIPETLQDKLAGLINNYLQPLGENKTKVIFVSVEVPMKGVLKKSVFEEEWKQIKEVIDTYGIKIVGVANPDYFNKILNAKKKLPFERMIGDVKEIDGLKVTPVLNFLAISISPMKKHLLDKSVIVLEELLSGSYKDTKKDLIDTLKFNLITNFDEAYKALKSYINEDKITIDIETTGLQWHSDELLTIAFAKNEAESFCIALHPKYSKDWKKNRNIVKKFFEKYKGKVILHNAQFDIPFLVYNFWMEHITDTENMIKGVNYFDLEDTMIMSYLCLNSIDRPNLKLKDLAYVKFGNWDNDINQKELLSHPFDEVAKYNSIDVLATMYIYNKFEKRLVTEKQENLYKNFYKRFLKAIIKMKMNGITIDMYKINSADEKLKNIYDKNLEYLNSTEEVKETIRLLKEKALKKGKRKSEIDKIEFNPKSTQHLRVLLFDVMGFTPTKFSKKTKEPATDKEVIRDLHQLTQEYTKEWTILNAIKEISEMKTVYSTFVKGFEEKAVKDKEGNYKLFPNYNITGTISGRMSGKDPNLLNIPSGSKYGKIIKETIIAQTGFIVLQIDSDQLEDRVIATASQDENKMNIFLKKIDGHCIGTAAYYKEELEERGIKVDITNPESVNKIKELAPDLRQASKPITFALAYGGTEHTLMSNIGFSEEKAKQIVKAYKELYKGITNYTKEVEKFILKNGYVIGVFGLKARGNLKDIIKEKDYQKAFRSLYNMTIQSSALIISQAIFRIQEWIEEKGYETKIKVTNSVYDSIYFEVVPDIKIIKELNEKIVEFMCPSYKDLLYNYIGKELKEIPLTASCEIGKSWIAEEELSNNADSEEIKEKLDKILKKETNE